MMGHVRNRKSQFAAGSWCAANYDEALLFVTSKSDCPFSARKIIRHQLKDIHFSLTTSNIHFHDTSSIPFLFPFIFLLVFGISSRKSHLTPQFPRSS